MSMLQEDPVNEVTFVSVLSTQTTLWHNARIEGGKQPFIAVGTIEDRQPDPVTGTYRRCDMRFMNAAGKRLANGEFKRPEVPQGRDPRNETLRVDARNKAIYGGVTYYFTCNMATVVLYALSESAGEDDQEVATFELAPITHSSGFHPYQDQIAVRWWEFLDYLDEKVRAVEEPPARVTAADVLTLRNAIEAVVEEAVDRAVRLFEGDETALAQLRDEADQKFGFPAVLDPRQRDIFFREIKQLLRFAAFVTAQKLLLYRVLQESGPRRSASFRLDPLSIPEGSTDPKAVEQTLDSAWGHAIERSEDFESAFSPKPLVELLFIPPTGRQEREMCNVGRVWSRLQKAVAEASWARIERNLVGLLWETVVDPNYRHELGQFYTREDVVDLLAAFAVRLPGDAVLDPACGGGSFLWSAYRRKRELGATHESALASVWGFEITSFAAELSTITLATADPTAPVAYPRVALTDFFAARPGRQAGTLEIPEIVGPVVVPDGFDGIIGNPPYISYRRIANQEAILDAVSDHTSGLVLPKFSGKSDEYVWFIVHATRFLKSGGRLSFVVSSALLFTDYGIPLVRFIGAHFRIIAVVDSKVERWFPDADTNTVLLLLERDEDPKARSDNVIRFVRLRRSLYRMMGAPDAEDRRQRTEDLVEAICTATPDNESPNLVVHLVAQGADGGLKFVLSADTGTGALIEDDEDEDE